MAKKKKKPREKPAAKPPVHGEEEFRIPLWALTAIFAAWLLFLGKAYFQSYPLSFQFLDIPDAFAFAARAMEVAAKGFGQILWMAAIFLISYRIGDAILKFSKTTRSNLEHLLFSLGLGFGFLIYFVLLIGSLGLLYPLPIKIIFAGVALLSLWKLKIPDLSEEFTLSGLRLRWKIASGLFLLFVLLNFAMAFMPETFYDALVYQLSVPNYYMLKHEITPMPYLAHSNFPLNINMLYLLSLLLHNEMLAKMIHFSLTLLSALTIYAAMNKFYSRKSAILSALIYYSIPILAINSWGCGNDAGLGFFFSLSVFSYLNWLKEDKNSYLFLAAVFAGLTLGSKYTAAYYVFPLALLTGVTLFKEHRDDFVKKFFTFNAVIFLFILPWMIKNSIFTGNPFHPFLAKFLGGENLYDFSIKITATPNILNFNFWKFLSSPWNMTMNHNQPQNFIGAAFLFFTPMVFLVKKYDALIKRIFVLFAASYILWYLSTPVFRFFLPAFGLISMFFGYSASKISEKNALFFSMAVFFVLPNFFSLANISQHKTRPYLARGMSKDEFLSRSRPSYPNPPYSALKWINENIPEDAKILFSGENKSYYLKREYITYSVETNLQPLMEFLKKSENASDFLRILESEGVTHLLINYREAVRVQPDYKTYYWGEREREIFGEFWKRHIKLEFFDEGTYVYSVTESAVEPAVNILERLETEGWTRQNLLKIFEERGMWNSLLDEYENLQRYGIDVKKQIEALKSMAKIKKE